MPHCTQIVGHMVGPDDELRVDIVCGKPATWRWTYETDAVVCDACHETYRCEPDLFVLLVAANPEQEVIHG